MDFLGIAVNDTERFEQPRAIMNSKKKKFWNHHHCHYWGHQHTFYSSWTPSDVTLLGTGTETN